jgi:hypothetical protein
MKQGDIVFHKLTNEKLMVSSVETFNRNCWPWKPELHTVVNVIRFNKRSQKYATATFLPFELREAQSLSPKEIYENIRSK